MKVAIPSQGSTHSDPIQVTFFLASALLAKVVYWQFSIFDLKLKKKIFLFADHS